MRIIGDSFGAFFLGYPETQVAECLLVSCSCKKFIQVHAPVLNPLAYRFNMCSDMVSYVKSCIVRMFLKLKSCGNGGKVTFDKQRGLGI